MTKQIFLRFFFSFLLHSDEAELEFETLNTGVVLGKLFFVIFVAELDDLKDFLLNNSVILYNLVFGRVY